MTKSQSRTPSDAPWITELIITFADATSERFVINRTKSGSILPPQLASEPAEWTRLEFHKCDCCPLSDAVDLCPAAESLDLTLMRFRNQKPDERVTATAIDSQQRYTVVDSDLSDICSTFVELAVFFSGCPVGKQFKSMMCNLRPFATAPELSRHLIGHFLIKNRGKLKDSRKEIHEKLDPLRSVFHFLSKRLSATTDKGTAKDSIDQLDQFAKMMEKSLREVYDDFKDEMEWDGSSNQSKFVYVNAETGEEFSDDDDFTGHEDTWIIRRLKRMLDIDE